MTVRNLERLLSPRSVALIGASERAGSIGRIVARNLLAEAFDGPVWLVNPRHRSIEGAPCFASIGALPGVPDLAVVATPPGTIPGVIGELAARGTKASVVITAGISRDLRQAMLDAARPHLLRIQGPNCLGLMLPGARLNASFCQRQALDGDLALVSQSGALVTAIVDWSVARGIGFSHIVSLGDMADVDFGDLLDYLAADTRSRAILLYMEQLTHAPKFLSAARRAARAKPVLVIKAGRHAAGARAALSHTGALAGSNAAYDAAFRRAGVLRVNELEDLFTAAEILSRMPRLEGERLTILTNGGGAGVLAADRLADLGGTLAPLSAGLSDALDRVLPATWSRSNPIDIIGDAGPDRYEAALAAVLEDRGSDAIVVMNCPTALASSVEVARRVLATLEQRKEQGRPSMPVLANWLGDGTAKESRALFAARSIPTFETPAAAIEGFMHLVRHARAQDELMRAPPPAPEEITFDTQAARHLVAAAVARSDVLLPEGEARRLLACYGVPVVPSETARSPHEVSEIARRLLTEHPACVVKILSPDITHKSDVGGVRLGLDTAPAAGEAAGEMLARIARTQPRARIHGFTVQPMIRRPRAHELLVGVSVDATFGPLITFGAGGTAVEVLRDTAMALPPLDMKLARDLMRQTRVHRLLEGYRDRPAADLDAIAMTLVRVSALVIAHPEVRELDINPLLADEAGVIALDARVRVADEGREPRVPLSIRPYPAKWERRVTLPGLPEILVRPIRPEDEHLYARLAQRTAPEDMRMRFFVARPDLSHKLIARLTQIDFAREMAFVAIDTSTGELIGVVRLVADPDYRRAEYAVLVASDLKGKGLGWLLMQQLIAYARSEGIEELFGQVLAGNTAMLSMCAELGFTIEHDAEDRGIHRVTLKLGGAAG